MDTDENDDEEPDNDDWLVDLIGPRTEWPGRLRDFLRRYQLTRAEAAKLLGVSEHTIAAKLQGKRPTRWRIASRVLLIDLLIKCRSTPPGWPKGHDPLNIHPNRLRRLSVLRRRDAALKAAALLKKK